MAGRGSSHQFERSFVRAVFGMKVGDMGSCGQCGYDAGGDEGREGDGISGRSSYLSLVVRG